MSAREKLAEDLAQLFSSAMGTAVELGHDAREAMGRRFEDMLSRMDLVRREDLDTINQRLAQQQVEIEALKAQLADMKGGKKPGNKAKS